LTVPTTAGDSAADTRSAPASLEDVQAEFAAALVAAGHLVPTGVEGVYGRGGAFEDVIERFDRLVTRLGAADRPEVLRFPPVVTRANFERSEYLKAFPNLAGVVHAFHGGDREHGELLARVEHGEPWGDFFRQADVVLTPAACYPLYPMCRGTLSPAGRLFDVQSYCFRHEPSPDPARMQLFRMHEYVRIGTAESAREFRDAWMTRGLEALRAVGLPAEVERANDPFFGRRGRMLAADQRDQSLKFELVVPICSNEKPTACMSFNYHQDHFGRLFGIQLPDGEPAHTACVGFGLERIALALFRHHGMDVARWPAAAREALSP
jgi:seryl-tRNA synthetase